MSRPWTWRRAHVWIGVGTGAWLALVASTGVLLTFRASLQTPEPVVPQSLRDAAPLAPMALVAEAERLSGAKATELYFSTAPEEAVCVVVDDERASEFYFSPGGVLLEVRHGADKGLTQWAFDLHTGAALGWSGEVAAAASGVGLLALVASGVVIWPWRLRRAKRRRLEASSRGDSAGLLGAS